MKGKKEDGEREKIKCEREDKERDKKNTNV